MIWLPGLRLGKVLLQWELLGLAVIAGWSSVGQEISLESVGVRGGFDAEDGHNFQQVEAWLNWNLPWMWDLGAGWWVRPTLEVTAGGLRDPGADAFIGTLGPAALFTREHFPLSFDAGVSPTLVSRYD